MSRCGPVNEDTAALFQPNSQLDLESGLVLGEGIVMLERGKQKLVIPVSNPTGKDIVIKAKTHVGVIVPVSSVLPCPIQLNTVSAEEKQEELSDEIVSRGVETPPYLEGPPPKGGPPPTYTAGISGPPPT